ncbi:flowering time control protein FCA isoform X1 [Rhododendron vialii]|uniref:flowering time control protein FCA isoform X1 n=1 Tax=Rhododendron vialii TaxID=182163 RepID=UPI00265F61BF|nr:flowering time control protein FCA isoform X1 [Rhododendron vialii]
MDRDRQRPEMYGDFSDSHRNSHSSTSSWSSDDPPPPPLPPHQALNSDAHRAGYPGDGDYHHHLRPHHHHHQTHRHHSNQRYNHQPNFNSEQHGPVPGSGPDDNPAHFGRKRPFFSSGCIEGGSFVKLYVGGIPRTATQEEVRSLFEEYGKIVEVVRLKDNRTYQPHECGFVKYATLEEADRAIGALHNKYTFPAGVAPIKVRYADGERERLAIGAFVPVRQVGSVTRSSDPSGGFGTQDCKLYVGCLNKQASKKEIEEIFSAYGLVENVYIVLDEVKQSRGSGFIQFSHRDMAIAAMNALSGTYVMRGCDQPLIVRFAEPKKPRIGEPRDSCKYGGSRPQEYVRPAPYVNDPRAGHTLPDASLPLSPKNMASSSQSPGTGGKPQTVSRTTSVSELVFPSIANPLDSDWSEHTCPDGYKYYYNCATCESRWEKPEEYLLLERVQKQLPQQMQLSSHQQVLDHMQVQAATTPTSVIISPTCV